MVTTVVSNKDVSEFLENYEFTCSETGNSRRLTQQEQVLVEDAIHGFLFEYGQPLNASRFDPISKYCSQGSSRLSPLVGTGLVIAWAILTAATCYQLNLYGILE